MNAARAFCSEDPAGRLSACRRWAVLTIALVIPALPSLADWPMFRHDPARSGWAEGALPEVAEVLWSAELAGPADSSPAVLGGVVFAATAAGTVHAVDAANGEERWRAEIGPSIVSSPCADAQRVYFGGVDGWIYALDAAGGRQAWKTRTGRSVVAPPLLIDGKVICGSTDGRLYALAADTGNVIWKTEAGAEIHAGAAAAGGLVVYGDWNRRVHCVRLIDGSSVWSRPYRAGGPVIACPVIADDLVIVSSLAPTALTPRNSLNIHSLELATGKRVWGAPGRNPWQTDKEHQMSVSTCPTVVGESIWFITMEGYGNWSAVLRSVALRTGARGMAARKLPRTGGLVISDASAAVAEGVLHMVDYSGLLLQFDATNNRPLNSLSLGARTLSSPAISDGRVYVGLTDGKLLCIR